MWLLRTSGCFRQIQCMVSHTLRKYNTYSKIEGSVAEGCTLLRTDRFKHKTNYFNVGTSCTNTSNVILKINTGRADRMLSKARHVCNNSNVTFLFGVVIPYYRQN